jgi:hypothetical protein
MGCELPSKCIYRKEKNYIFLGWESLGKFHVSSCSIHLLSLHLLVSETPFNLDPGFLFFLTPYVVSWPSLSSNSTFIQLLFEETVQIPSMGKKSPPPKKTE